MHEYKILSQACHLRKRNYATDFRNAKYTEIHLSLVNMCYEKQMSRRHNIAN